MLKVKVLKNKIEVQVAKFDSSELMQAWLDMLASTAAWGKPDRWLTEFEVLREGLEPSNLTRVSTGSLGEEIIEYFYPAEYTIEVTDITAQVQAEAAAKALKDQEKLDAIAKFKATDFKKDLSNKELTELVMMLYKEVFKNEV